MHTYGKGFRISAFHVVHRSVEGKLGSAVAGSNDEMTARRDAAQRNERANSFGLDCSYVVRLREDGEYVKPAPDAASLPVADAVDAAARSG